MNNFLNLDDLYTPHIQRDKNKLKYYEGIYKKCIRKINKTNNDLRLMECFYKVPLFELGTPLYDYNELKNYLIFKLEENGLRAEYIDGQTLYISWKPEDVNRAQYQKKLEKIQSTLESEYNTINSNNIYETPVKSNSKQKSVYGNNNRVGILKYNNSSNDMIPVNPAKICKYEPKTLVNFPTSNRSNTFENMLYHNLNNQYNPRKNSLQAFLQKNLKN